MISAFMRQNFATDQLTLFGTSGWIEILGLLVLKKKRKLFGPKYSLDICCPPLYANLPKVFQVAKLKKQKLYFVKSMFCTRKDKNIMPKNDT